MSDNTHRFPVDQYGALDLRTNQPEPKGKMHGDLTIRRSEQTGEMNGDVIDSLPQPSFSFDSTNFPKCILRTFSSRSKINKSSKTTESLTTGNINTEELSKNCSSDILKSPKVFQNSIESNSSSKMLKRNSALLPDSNRAKSMEKSRIVTSKDSDKSNRTSGILSENVATDLVSSNNSPNMSKPSISSDSLVSPYRSACYNSSELFKDPKMIRSRGLISSKNSSEISGRGFSSQLVSSNNLSSKPITPKRSFVPLDMLKTKSNLPVNSKLSNSINDNACLGRKMDPIKSSSSSVSKFHASLNPYLHTVAKNFFQKLKNSNENRTTVEAYEPGNSGSLPSQHDLIDLNKIKCDDKKLKNSIIDQNKNSFMSVQRNNDVVRSLQADSRYFTVNEARNFQNNLVGKNYERFHPMKMSTDMFRNNYYNPANYMNKMGCSRENFKDSSKDQSENNYFEAIHKRNNFLTSKQANSGQLYANNAYNFRKCSVGGTNDGKGKSLIDLAYIASNYKKFEDSRIEQEKNNDVTSSMRADSRQLTCNEKHKHKSTFVNENYGRINQLGMSSDISRSMQSKKRLLDSYEVNFGYKKFKDCRKDQVKNDRFAHLNRSNEAATPFRTGSKDSRDSEAHNCENSLVSKNAEKYNPVVRPTAPLTATFSRSKDYTKEKRVSSAKPSNKGNLVF